MNWDDLTAAWRNQPRERIPEAKLEGFKTAFAKKSRGLTRRLFWRDVLEFVAACIVIYVLAKAALNKGWAGWPLWISNALILGVAIFFLRERIRVRRKRTRTDATLVQKVEADLAELRHQRHLLLNVGTWYVGPLGLAWFIGLASTRFHGLGGHLHTALQMGGDFVGCLLFFGFVLILNRRCVRKCIEPAIAELESLRDGLTAEC